MSTSGTYNFTLNKSQIIARAFQAINVYSINETVRHDDFVFASDILNMMIKSWEAEGIKLWKRRQATLFPNLDQYIYELGSVSGADNVTNTYHSTTASSTAASGASSIIATSVSGMATSDYIGIELDDGTRQWTTISSIASSTITLATTLTDSVTNGNTIITYTSKINRPLQIIRASLLDLDNNSETVMAPITFDQYFNLPIKTTEGRPNNFYYDKLLNNSLPFTGTLYLFPQPDNVNNLVSFTYYDSLQDMLNLTDNADFPQEWLFPIVTNLSAELCAWGYGKFVELGPLQQKADKLKMLLSNFDNDDEPLKFKFSHNYNRD